MVDTDSLINSAIEARSQREAQRRNIEARRHELAQQLAGTSRKNRGRTYQLRSELQGLDAADRAINTAQRSEDNLTNLRVQSQFRNAHLATKALDDQRHDETARQVTNISNGLAKLEAKYPNRGFDASQSEKFHSEIEQLGNDNALGMQNKTASARMFQAAQFHDQIRQKTLNNAARTLATLTKGLSPEEFANRDHSKDFSTNATDLNNAVSADQKINLRANNGTNTVFEAGGNKYMIPTTAFNHYDSNFKLQPTAQSLPVPPDQNTGIQRIVPTYGGQGAAPPGGLVRNPDGSIVPIVPTYGGEGAAPPGALVRTGVAQIGTPPLTGVPKEEQIIQPGTATVPPGVQPNPPLQPVTQLGTQPMTGEPQVAQQPTGTPDPRIELAQRALTDPNATDAHKAAARQILGIKEDGQ